MTEFNLSKLRIDGKELGMLIHESSIKELVEQLKEDFSEFHNRDTIMAVVKGRVGDGLIWKNARDVIVI